MRWVDLSEVSYPLRVNVDLCTSHTRSSCILQAHTPSTKWCLRARSKGVCETPFTWLPCHTPAGRQVVRAGTVEEGLASLQSGCAANAQVADVVSGCPADAIGDAEWPTLFTSVVGVTVATTTLAVRD